MNRTITTILVYTFSLFSVFGQTPAGSSNASKTSAGPPSAAAASKPPVAGPDQLAPTVPVLSIHGYCPGGDKSKPESCTTTVTKEEFSRLLSAMNLSPQFLNNPVAIRTFAESYVQALALSDAAEKSGLDKDPQFLELMRVIRVRNLADAYKRKLKQANATVAPEEIENYYKQNQAKYEQLDLDRISIPRINTKLAKDAQAEFDKNAQKAASDAHDRIERGDDPAQAQAAAYKTLGLTPPLTTDLGSRRKTSLPTALQQELSTMKPGEITKAQLEPGSITFYKLRGRHTLPLESAKSDIEQELHQKSMQTALEEATGKLHTDFNEQYFGSKTAPRPAQPMPATPQVTSR